MNNDTVSDVFGGRLRVRVCGLCTDDAGRLLLTLHKGLGPAGRLWIPPGGGMHYGEPAEECLVREIYEETGLTTEAEELLFIYEYLQKPLHAVELYFKARITGGEIRQGYDPELNDDQQIIQKSEFLGKEQINGIPLNMRHEILKKYMTPKDLLGLRGYFRFH
ncbi:MAG: NUDIX hydrolase [Cyclobacteriaceae bacterium]